MGCQVPPNKCGGSCCILVTARPLCIASALFLMRPASGRRCGKVNFPLSWNTHYLLPPFLSPCLLYRPLLLLHTWVTPWFPLYIHMSEIDVLPCHMRYRLYCGGCTKHPHRLSSGSILGATPWSCIPDPCRVYSCSCSLLTRAPGGPPPVLTIPCPSAPLSGGGVAAP
jgi:hypothetical protein